MTIVLAQGTFDILHPGHVHYLEEAASMGNELYVVVARIDNVDHKPTPIVPAEQRRDLVESLDPVDQAILGHPEDIFAPLKDIDPDVIVLGYDQHHNETILKDQLDQHGFKCDVQRASPYYPTYNNSMLSSSDILERAIDKREHHVAARMRPPSIRSKLF